MKPRDASSKQSPKSARGCPVTAESRQAGRKRFWFAVTAASVLLLAGGAVWWRAKRAPALPEVNLDQVDPKVASVLRQRIEEARRKPHSAEDWGKLGALLWTYNFRSAAVQCLAQAERLDPQNPRWPYYHALCFIIATPTEAIPLLQKTVSICGNSPEAPRYRLAGLLGEQGRWPEARRELDLLLADKPDFMPARLLSARAAQAAGATDAAIELARSCTEDSRTARAAWLLLGALYREKGDAVAAGKALRQSTTLPADAVVGDPYEAEALLMRGDPRLLCEQAHPLLAAGNLAQAAVLINLLKQQHVDYAETWLLVGRLELLKKNLGDAETALKRHLEMSPRSVQGLFQLGMVLLAQGRFPDAAAAFRKATELKPDFGAAHYNCGVALARAGDFHQAIESFQESIRHNPERIESYLLLADLQLRSGDSTAAATLLEQAQNLNPAEPRLHALKERLEAARASRSR